MEVKGTIKKVGQTKIVSDKFKNRELILQTAEKYPQLLKIEFQQDKVSLLDNANVGDKVLIRINLRGREYKENVYNSIVGWYIEPQNTQSELEF